VRPDRTASPPRAHGSLHPQAAWLPAPWQAAASRTVLSTTSPAVKTPTVRQLLLRQSRILPLAALRLPILIGFSAPGYSSLSQHVSELQLLDHPVAALMRVAPLVCGLSILLFGLGAWLIEPARFTFTALTSAAVAANFISAGLWVTGSPLHGLYGVGFFIPLVPACFAAESGMGPSVRRVCLTVAVLSMAYLWLNLSGLDPLRGLSQRLAIVLILGWYTYASHQLLRAFRGNDPKTRRTADGARPDPLMR